MRKFNISIPVPTLADITNPMKHAKEVTQAKIADLKPTPDPLLEELEAAFEHLLSVGVYLDNPETIAADARYTKAIEAYAIHIRSTNDPKQVVKAQKLFLKQQAENSKRVLTAPNCTTV